MTPDLERLRKATKKLAWLIDEIELTLVDDPSWPEPSDHGYLQPAERKNPDIAANVLATNATNRLISWFGRDMKGWVGLWRGPADTALSKAPIVRLDTEGQYRIVAFTIGDWIAITAREDYFADARRDLVAAGFKVARSVDAIYETFNGRDRSDAPNDYRNRLYAENTKLGVTLEPAKAAKTSASKPAKKPANKVKKSTTKRTNKSTTKRANKSAN